MPIQLVIALVSVFLSIALLSGLVASLVLMRASPEHKRLIHPAQRSVSKVPVVVKRARLASTPDPLWDRLSRLLPTSRGSVERLRRDLALAGFHKPGASVVLSAGELLFPVLMAVPPIFLLTGFNRWLAALLGAVIGYMAPGVLLGMRIRRRKKEIQNGLADTLDLLVLCLEAGSGLDQALVKASEELGVAYPALSDQLHILLAEMRAGKGRLEAFRGLAERTRVEDVRALVSMLVQTDRFGTSIAQALRSHADVCRTKRRQRAEERAQKVGVKLVFPLVFCLFPALYVVMLGPAFIQFSRVFSDIGPR